VTGVIAVSDLIKLTVRPVRECDVHELHHGPALHHYWQRTGVGHV
jgi:hypothetical protein